MPCPPHPGKPAGCHPSPLPACAACLAACPPCLQDQGRAYLNNHLSFTILYHKDAETDLARIVGFEVEPYSVAHKYTGGWLGGRCGRAGGLLGGWVGGWVLWVGGWLGAFLCGAS
jgi:hypothetical protein